MVATTHGGKTLLYDETVNKLSGAKMHAGPISAQIEASENPEDWEPIVERITHQIMYRQLGIVSLPCPIRVAAEVIGKLTKEGKGSWFWLLENRALVWENIPINQAVKIHAYVFGSSTRQKNSVFVRMGWWRFYFLEAGMRVFNVSLIGRILAEVRKR